ncbi:MAG: hypothetical protein WHS44_05075 [Fimbriimonadales bacterium]
MAVLGEREFSESRAPVGDGLMFWGVQYRRLSLVELARGVWFFALWAGLTAVFLAPVLAQAKGGAGLYLILGWVVALHLLARGWLERRLPDPSFAADVRTGNFEQLRLTPFTAHGLLLQRGLPDMMFRAATQAMWLPVYALVAGALGASLLDACVLWLLFSFASYFVLGLVSIALLAPAWEAIAFGLSVGLLSYALLLDGGRVRTAVASSSLFAVMLALPIVGRVLLPTPIAAPLPDLTGFALTWLIIEALRFERLARWVNAPSGVWRGFYLLPSAALLTWMGLTVWHGAALQGRVGAEATQSMALAMFGMVGYLNLLLLTLRRQAEPVAQPLRAHLVETGLLRVISLLLTGGAVLVWGLPTGAAAFWQALAWLSAVEWLGSALTRWALQRAHSRARGGVYLALALGFAPALVFAFAPLHFALGALSPTYALTMASSVWQMTRLAAQPPLEACLLLPIVRYALVLGVLTLAIRFGRATQPAARPNSAWGWLALPLLYPMLDWLARRYAVNPISRITIAERQPPFAPLAGITALCIVMLASGAGNWGVVLLLMVPLGVFLWLWGYHTTAKRVRRWIDSGELTSAFLAGLTPTQIFWGWVYGAWYQQMRILLAVFGGVVLGWMAGVLTMGGGGMGWNAAQLLFFVLTTGAAFVLAYLGFWSCAWLIAAPAAVRDMLNQLRAPAPILTPRTTLQAGVFAMLGCCAPLAPFLLIGLPIYASQSTLALHRMARAPGELSRRYGIS